MAVRADGDPDPEDAVPAPGDVAQVQGQADAGDRRHLVGGDRRDAGPGREADAFRRQPDDTEAGNGQGR
ncbi:MAG: hypothetical protein PW844_11630 [Pantoea sp.]|uniref:hypothetical protein n=1 Tax=Pantoea sp. TaxID=69393 RepID=UPI0023985E0E|nr:hypothetical protein [Pantoea sp.]MDE1187112.1 hypothetical protein [Pantoea sp.]